MAHEVSCAVILAGGFGTRLRTICPDIPKGMIPVLGRPFLDYLVEYLSRQGIPNIVISTGYLGDQIESFFSRKQNGYTSIRCIREERPLGTGGAVSYVAHQIGARGYLLVCNGDSLSPFSRRELESALMSGADAAVAAVHIDDCSRFGSLSFDDSGMMTAFTEKRVGSSGVFINAGVYLIDARMLPDGAEIRTASIEHDYFPKWMSEGRKIKVIPSEGPFIDIGTPESLESAADYIKTCGMFRLG